MKFLVSKENGYSHINSINNTQSEVASNTFIDIEGIDSNNTRYSFFSHMTIKRIFDLSIILLFLPLVVPVMVVTAIMIKLESKGNILFWQRRVGLNGVPFDIVKFRSMSINSEDHGSQFATEGDARITRLGKFIRQMRIDELPQLWNVLKGEMSLIGPRPEQVAFVNEFKQTIPKYNHRHAVLPGITGLAQTKQGYVDDDDGTRTKLKYDLHYIANISLFMDIRIVFLTLYTIVTGFGAR